jgi:hypothetical protein
VDQMSCCAAIGIFAAIMSLHGGVLADSLASETAVQLLQRGRIVEDGAHYDVVDHV